MIAVNFFASINIVNSLLVTFTWLLIAFFVIRIYKKLPEKPKVWKMLLVLLVGLFSFTISINGLGTILRIPILPLGVWILFLLTRRDQDSWQKYRRFAWLGFFANLIFLVMTIVEMPIQYLIYPPSEPSTYIANINHASIIVTNPSGKQSLLDKESLKKQLPNLKQKNFSRAQWYEETYLSDKTKNKKERFPYQLIGVNSKWGSNLNSIIFIEKDGKGILITTAKKQYYYQFKDSIMKWGGE